MNEKDNNNIIDNTDRYIRSIYWLLSDSLGMSKNALRYIGSVLMVIGVLSIGLMSTARIAYAIPPGDIIYEIYELGFPSDLGELTGENEWRSVWDLSDPTHVCGLEVPVRLDRATSTPPSDLRFRLINETSSTTIETFTLAPSELSETFATTTINFSSCRYLDPDDNFGFYFDVDGTGSDTDYYEISREAVGNAHSFDIVNEKPGGVWTIITPAELTMVVYGVTTEALGDGTTTTFGTTTINSQLFETVASTTPGFSTCPQSTQIFSSTTVPAFFCNLKNELWSLMTYMVVPSQASIDVFDDSVNDFKGTFPFNIFFDTANTLYVVSQTANSEQPTITFPALTSSTTNAFPSFEFVSSTTVSDFIGASAYSDFREFLDNFIWASLGFIILFTII